MVHEFSGAVTAGFSPVLRLLKANPFPETPPRYIRARLFEYQFTNELEKRQTGAWWKRAEQGLYCPPVSLRGED